MIIDNIKNFKNGWVIGNFEPCLLKTNDFEVSIQHHKKGFIGQKHFHKESVEYNVITTGKVNICGKELMSGDIFIFDKNEISESYFLEDTTIVVIRTPSIPTDKYVV
jgi:hypothetical protein